ncbi:MAG: hypothetical protein A2Y15_04650 [Clostridiales bacterium GWF2_36_10]|nr:MAG: hypothetical protein A2Y15_04650 [Clostridiales bacterium GWF2_36_10]HAN20878.1 hypothetical protein [Clostridiales bacterium]
MTKIVIYVIIFFIIISSMSTVVGAKNVTNDINITNIFNDHGTEIIIIFALFIFILLILILNNKKLKILNKNIININNLMKTFGDAEDSLVYLKDENLKYVFINKAFESVYKIQSEKIIGHDDTVFLNDERVEHQRQTDLDVLKNGKLIIEEAELQGYIYKITKFPVKMLNGKFGVGAYLKDITDERIRLKKTEKILYRHKILVDVLNSNFKSRQEQLDYVLHQALELTESKYGYIYMYDEEKRQFTLNSWTIGVMEACQVMDKQSTYHLDKTGIWGEVVRQRKPIIVNNFKQPNPLKKGHPAGHIALSKFMSIPVIIDEKILAVIGLANKINDYDDNDVYEMILLMNGVWNAVERREKQERLSFERNKYLQTLFSIGDGVLVVDKNGNIDMLNKVAEDLTGWTLSQALGKQYKEIFDISDENKEMVINDPIQKVFETDNVQEFGNHAILTSKNGIKYSLEDSAAPIKDDSGETVGVILVFRDVTDKMEQRKKIDYLSFHDSLTGLYNRRFFEDELRRLDNKQNLPLSIIMGDVNGLKLTNDIFGHTYGDKLLENTAQVMCNVCKNRDIIARWGGDEFIILLPQTSYSEAQDIAFRIKDELKKVQIKAIRGSISIGTDTKQDEAQSILCVLNRAEEKMYEAKSIERDNFKSQSIDTIIKTLHENNPREKEHSIHVSELCGNMGKMLNLSNVEIRKLREAGYLHDIGKIVLEPKLLNKNVNINDEEWNEIKKHPVIGYRILNSFDSTIDMAEIVLSHQERWDGSGYPKGLKSEEIPMLSRIINLAENYERKLYGSSNFEPISKEEAIKAIREKSGLYFDPLFTEIFIKMVESSD